ncbi:hypothetical protein L1887_49741 [Cichorium endivia]|nr:hypothetical protein L1887_49741 [Cichorium endivia]
MSLQMLPRASARVLRPYDCGQVQLARKHAARIRRHGSSPDLCRSISRPSATCPDAYMHRRFARTTSGSGKLTWYIRTHVGDVLVPMPCKRLTRTRCRSVHVPMPSPISMPPPRRCSPTRPTSILSMTTGTTTGALSSTHTTLPAALHHVATRLFD